MRDMPKCKHCENKLKQVEMETMVGWDEKTQSYPVYADKSWWCDFCDEERYVEGLDERRLSRKTR